MTRPANPRRRRPGFTLVELMVACALVVLILTILAVAFGTATDSFRHLKAVGDMAGRLRTTQDVLRADLEADHFEPGDSPVRLRLSDLRYDRLTAGGSEAAPPRGGYFRIEQAGGSIYEGPGADGVWSTRATTHALEFTARRRGKTPDDLFTVRSPTLAPAPPGVNYSATDTAVGANQFTTHWARVRWFLGNPQNSNGVQTYTLYRRTWAVAPARGVPLADPDERELVATGGGATRTLADLRDPATRPAAPQYTGTHYGDDIVLTNVLSFEVKPTWDSGGAARAPRTTVTNPGIGAAIPDGVPASGGVANSDYPYDDLPGAAVRVFDTGNDVNTLPLRIRVTGVQIKIRVFDPKTQMTRQVTVVVDL